MGRLIGLPSLVSVLPTPKSLWCASVVICHEIPRYSLGSWSHQGPITISNSLVEFPSISRCIRNYQDMSKVEMTNYMEWWHGQLLKLFKYTAFEVCLTYIPTTVMTTLLTFDLGFQRPRRRCGSTGAVPRPKPEVEEMEKKSNLKCFTHFTQSRFWRSEGKTL